jgi:hypothetical protein
MPTPARARRTVAAVAAYVAVQALVPLRHFAYPGNVSWTEEGHLFAWHMKLRDKDASARFVVKDADTGDTWTTTPRAYLTRRQAARMAGHPDMILQFAHHLAQLGRDAGRPHIEVRAITSASVNGRDRQALVDPETDLAAQPRTLRPAPWIVPLQQPLRKGPRRAEAAEEE